jgi:hypothetical protein
MAERVPTLLLAGIMFSCAGYNFVFGNYFVCGIMALMGINAAAAAFFIKL